MSAGVLESAVNQELRSPGVSHQAPGTFSRLRNKDLVSLDSWF